MAGESSLLCEEQFECIICTEFFRNPVTLPCGHNFCQVCIEQHWRDKKVRKCPLCNQEFDKSLKLSINTVFRDIVESFKQDYDVSESEKPSGPDQVLCDCCLQSKRRAAQTCLVCLTSYCTAHLEPHRRVAALTTHTLTDPVPNLHQNMCTKHHRILEESSCGQGMVCALCSSNETSSTRGDNKVVKNDHYVKLRNSKKTKKSRKWAAAPRMEDAEVNDETESEEEVHIWHNNVLFRFSRLPPHAGFTTGRVYYDVPNTSNSSCAIGVVNRKQRGKLVFDTKPQGRWVMRCDNVCACSPECPMRNIQFPDRLLLCVDYNKGLLFIVHPLGGSVLLCMTNCNFKGELFLFTYQHPEKYLGQLVHTCTSNYYIVFGIVFIILLLLYVISDANNFDNNLTSKQEVHRLLKGM